jgi:hypothetical protein
MREYCSRELCFLGEIALMRCVVRHTLHTAQHNRTTVRILLQEVSISFLVKATHSLRLKDFASLVLSRLERYLFPVLHPILITLDSHRITD